MNNKVLIALLVVVVAIGAFVALRSNNKSETTSSGSPKQSYTAPPTNQPGSNQPSAPAQSATVTYTSNGFSPATLTVKAGTTVTFRNEASDQMWVASNPHPVHTDYSGFDAKRSYNSGESYSFTFTNKGMWGYHNHLDPGDGGTIVVE